MNLNESVPCEKTKAVNESCDDARFNMIYIKEDIIESGLKKIKVELFPKIDSLVGTGDSLKKEAPDSQKDSINKKAWLSQVLRKQENNLKLIQQLIEKIATL